jgi:hypothetical protein
MGRFSRRSDAVWVAFWGSTNARDGCGAHAIARQLRACEAVLRGHGEIVRFHYETPVPVSDSPRVAVRAAGGPRRWDGDWDQLATAVAAADGGFDAVIRDDLARIGRRASRLSARLSLLAGHHVRIIRATHAWSNSDGFSQLGERFARSLTLGLGDHGGPAAGTALKVSGSGGSARPLASRWRG